MLVAVAVWVALSTVFGVVWARHHWTMVRDD